MIVLHHAAPPKSPGDTRTGRPRSRRRTWRHLSHGLVVSFALLAGFYFVAPASADPLPRVNANGGLLRVREHPSTSARITARYADGTAVHLTCQVRSEGRSWVKLTSGKGYLAKEYMSGLEALPECAQTAFPPGPRICALTGAPSDVRNLLMGQACALSPEMAHDVLVNYPKASDGPRQVFENWRDLGDYPRPLRGEHVDGCSVWKVPRRLANKPDGYDFTDACDTHDFGYRLMDRDLLPESAKGTVDDVFREVMHRICDTQYYRHAWDIGERTKCRAIADSYYQVVHLHHRSGA